MMMRRKLFILPAILLTMLTGAVDAQDFPDKPVPPRLVNDFAGMLSSNEVNALESKLVTFDDSTSTQIAIVTVTSLHGYDKADYAQRLGEKWGIGQKGKNNGILILVKPKSESENGEVYIAQGYGLEGAIPDLPASEIVNNEILPAFRAGDYYKGLDKATSTLMSLAKGEFSADEFRKKAKHDYTAITPFIIILIFIIIMISVRRGGGSNQQHISNKGLPFWMLLSMMNSRNSHNGSWGGFSGGGGGFGGGGGGFGGFGGGSFGGGGAGGSW